MGDCVSLLLAKLCLLILLPCMARLLPSSWGKGGRTRQVTAFEGHVEGEKKKLFFDFIPFMHFIGKGKTGHRWFFPADEGITVLHPYLARNFPAVATARPAVLRREKTCIPTRVQYGTLAAE